MQIALHYLPNSFILFTSFCFFVVFCSMVLLYKNCWRWKFSRDINLQSSTWAPTTLFNSRKITKVHMPRIFVWKYGRECKKKQQRSNFLREKELISLKWIMRTFSWMKVNYVEGSEYSFILVFKIRNMGGILIEIFIKCTKQILRQFRLLRKCYKFNPIINDL